MTKVYRVYMRFPGGKKKALTLSYDDGVKQDARLIDIMQKNGLKGTFNLNSGSFPLEQTGNMRLTEAQAKELFIDSGMEVAIHGLSHTFLSQLTESHCSYEVIKDRENLERLFCKVIRGMAYPNNAYNDKVVACLKSAGIAYARTTISTESFKIPTDWLRLETTCHHKNPRLMELAKKFVEEDVIKESWLFYLWGHSIEFHNDNNWNIIEEFAEYTGNRHDIWYATNIEIYEYIEAYRSLVSSVDGTMITNPTAYTVYIEISGKVYGIKSGETLNVGMLA